jgi:hypothetical protein
MACFCAGLAYPFHFVHLCSDGLFLRFLRQAARQVRAHKWRTAATPTPLKRV